MHYTQANTKEVRLKHPKSNLWNFVISKWTDEQKKEYEFLRTGKKHVKPVPMKKIQPKQKKKVIRVSDGKEYESITTCARDNKICVNTITDNCKGKQDRYKFYEV